MSLLRENQVAELMVRAGAPGVVQQVLIEVGQQVASATPLTKVAQPDRLKAELKMPETQVRDIAIGQPVSVDTRNGITQGHVERVDPAVEGLAEGSRVILSDMSQWESVDRIQLR